MIIFQDPRLHFQPLCTPTRHRPLFSPFHQRENRRAALLIQRPRGLRHDYAALISRQSPQFNLRLPPPISDRIPSSPCTLCPQRARVVSLIIRRKTPPSRSRRGLRSLRAPLPASLLAPVSGELSLAANLFKGRSRALSRAPRNYRADAVPSLWRSRDDTCRCLEFKLNASRTRGCSCIPSLGQRAHRVHGLTMYAPRPRPRRLRSHPRHHRRHRRLRARPALAGAFAFFPSFSFLKWLTVPVQSARSMMALPAGFFPCLVLVHVSRHTMRGIDYGLRATFGGSGCIGLCATLIRKMNDRVSGGEAYGGSRQAIREITF